MRRLARILLTTMAAAVGVAVSFAQTGDPVVVLLHSEANVVGKVVKVGDVARLDGGPAGLREVLSKLDIGEWQEKADRLVVSRNDVKFRLLVGGHSERAFVV